MSALLFELSAAPSLADEISHRLGCDRGELDQHQFPDGECYVRLASKVSGRDVMLLCTLDRPDQKIMPLLFTAAAARDQGARSVGLIAPYLAYMRQDKAFHSGEAVTSVTFAKLLSDHVDWLVTLDPHLHRHKNVDEIYSVPVATASAAECIGEWISREIDRPVIIGPDEESRRLAERVARAASAPVTIFAKTRTGDRSVSIDHAELTRLNSGQAVIVDDIASSAGTMIEAVTILRRHGYPNPTCIVVHPIFAGDAYDRLRRAGVAQVIGTNSIAHESNGIDISAELAEAVWTMISKTPPIPH